MRIKLLSLVAATALLAACSHENTQSTAATSAPPPPPPAEGGPPPMTNVSALDELKTQVGDRVHFDFDKSSIRDEDKEIVERQAEFTKKYPNLTFSIEGHCDPRGTREYNLALGERRATSLKNALVALGVDANRLKTISYGKERPEEPGTDESAYAADRRAVLVIENGGGPTS